MEKLAVDTYSFERLRTKGFTYVDKTAGIAPLVDESSGFQFFLARPRRFGKSLLISTLQALFEGKRELFHGLAIEPQWNWEKRWPVLHLDLGSCEATTVTELRENLLVMLQLEAARNGIAVHADKSAPNQLLFLINDLAQKSGDGKIVLLIDEYDKPILKHLSQPDVSVFRDELRKFYSVIKTTERLQRFAFITGISKFSKMSIFSDLNNLVDLSMEYDSATLLGYTCDELMRCFPESLAKIGSLNGKSADWALAEVERWYDGYRFHPKAEPVINPVSFGCCARNGEFKDYWSKTALAFFLIDALKVQKLDFSKVDVDESALESYEPEKPRLVTLLYQTGYLTIKRFWTMGAFRRYDLDFPNLEVEQSFLTTLAPAYAGVGDDQFVNFQAKAAEAVLAGDLAQFVAVLKSFFANVPYDLTDRQNEQTWQTIVYVVLRSVGVGVQAEVRTNDGRIDMVCPVPGGLWLIEFKLDHSAEEALAQIDEKTYAAKYDFTGKKITKVGISFSSKARNIVDCKVAVAQ